MAKAISLSPTQQFEGNDGNWSTFYVMVGDVSQAYHVLPATSQSATWLIPTDACNSSFLQSPVPANCDDLRGHTFDRNAAYTGVDTQTVPNFKAWVMPYTDAEVALDNNTYNGTGWGGTSSVILGGERSDASVSNQAIAFPVDSTPFLGLIGISARPAQITQTLDYDSALMALNKSGQIPSSYWAYHAGASYASPPVLGSLTFGGYDSRRGNATSFVVPFYSENTREFLVNIPAITISSSTSSSSTTHLSNVNAMIDSLVAELWLPRDICDEWESRFNLTWNDTKQIYTLDAEQHQNLLDLNPNITFTLAKNSTAPESDWTDITLPYAAFDLSVSFWPEGDDSGQYYFPIKRAADDTQYVLGRTFLQEAYVTADYDRKQFSVSQAIMNGGSNIVDVLPESAASTLTPSPNPVPETDSDSLSSGAIAGIVVGIVVAAIAAFALFCWLFWRPRKQRKQEAAAKHQREQSVATFDTYGASNPAAPPYGEWHRASSVGIDPLFTDNKIGNEQKEKQELDANFTARVRATSAAMSRHELAAGSVRQPSETRTGRGSISPMAERRPGHERTTSDTPSFGVSTLQSLSGPQSPPGMGYPSPPLDSQGRPSPPLPDMHGWYGGPIFELPDIPRSMPDVQEVSATEILPRSETSAPQARPHSEPPAERQQEHVIEAEDAPRESVSVSEVTSEDEAAVRASDVTETPVNETGPGTRLLQADN